MRELDTIDRIGVVGAGTMGSGIAQVAATAGYDVVMRDVEAEFVERGFDTIEGSLSRFVDRDRFTEDEADEIVGRIEGTT
ncbi:MAG TPA: 3-hydroxyacyl-CoA dehydrogenase NAD-binding domain-containing protein, partial [Natrialbaceae archaeon]|nr:3-hydroxyacyl-CoA dehydrogenase NAD-binding domain-containing protein [Natrialbaceae archaeon]